MKKSSHNLFRNVTNATTYTKYNYRSTDNGKITAHFPLVLRNLECQLIFPLFILYYTDDFISVLIKINSLRGRLLMTSRHFE